MRRTLVLAAAFLVALPAFGHVVVAQTAPLTPAQIQAEITQALSDAGVDPTIAAVTAQMLQLALAGAQVQASLNAAASKAVTDLETKESTDIQNVNDALNALNTTLTAQIAAIPQGPQGLIGPNGKDAVVAVGAVTTGAPGSAAAVTNSGTPGAAVLNFVIPQGAAGPSAFTPYAVPVGYVIPIIADQMTGGCLFTGGKCTGWTSIKGGGLYGQELIFGGTAGDSGSFYDYSIVVPQAGNYGVSLNVAITTGTSSFTGHFECPIGTPIGSVSYSNAGLTNPANPFVAKIGSVTLPAGPQTLRFFLDAAPAGNSSGMVNWYYFAKLP